MAKKTKTKKSSKMTGADRVARKELLREKLATRRLDVATSKATGDAAAKAASQAVKKIARGSDPVTAQAFVAAATKAATKAVAEAVRGGEVTDASLRTSDLAAVAAGAVQALTTPSAEVKKQAKRERSKGTAENRSDTARRMILAGHTNEEVLDALIELHGLDPAKHKAYPQWYRNELVRDGKLSETRAKMTAH